MKCELQPLWELLAARVRSTANSSDVIRVLIFVCWIVGAVCLPASAAATSVVALIDNSNHRIVMAADCHVRRDLGSRSECKIIDEPGCTVAIAGLFVEKATDFNLRRLVTAACQYPGDLHSKAEAFLCLAKAPYERAVSHIRDVDPIDFRRTMENKPTEVIFAGLQKGRLILLVRGLIADSGGKVLVERYEVGEGRQSPVGFVAGLNLQVRQYFDTHHRWAEEDYLTAARQFVELEINANPDFAGFPISEVEIDNRGSVRWISRGACSASEAD